MIWLIGFSLFSLFTYLFFFCLVFFFESDKSWGYSGFVIELIKPVLLTVASLFFLHLFVNFSFSFYFVVSGLGLMVFLI